MIERKSVQHYTKEIQDDGRTVVGIFAVHGNVDSGGDRSHPGAFDAGKSDRVRFVWQHSMTDPPIAAVNYIREVGRNELPSKVLEAAPDATGGAEISRTYLDTPRGNEVLAGIKAGAIAEMSYSFDPLQFDFTTEGEKEQERVIRNLHRVRLYDVSDVLWGMNPATAGVKQWSGADLTFTQHSESVVLLLDEFAERVRSRADFRLAEGRTLSEKQREDLQTILAHVEEAKRELATILRDTEPKANPDEVKRVAAKVAHSLFRVTALGVPNHGS